MARQRLSSSPSGPPSVMGGPASPLLCSTCLRDFYADPSFHCDSCSLPFHFECLPRCTSDSMLSPAFESFILCNYCLPSGPCSSSVASSTSSAGFRVEANHIHSSVCTAVADDTSFLVEPDANSVSPSSSDPFASECVHLCVSLCDGIGQIWQVFRALKWDFFGVAAECDEFLRASVLASFLASYSSIAWRICRLPSFGIPFPSGRFWLRRLRVGSYG